MKPTRSVFLFLFTAVIFFDAFASDVETAGRIIGQKNFQYDYGQVKGIARPAYVVTRKPVADPIILPVPIQPDQEKTDLHTDGTGVVYFKFGSSKLSRVEEQKLYRWVNIINNDRAVEVTGYTCPAGALDVNNRLAWQRAETVAAWLKRHGIKVRLISGKPKCCYVSDSEPARNRRVEIVFNPDTEVTPRDP